MAEISVGIVTALPIEAYAVESVVDGIRDHPEVPGDPNYYRSGWLPSKDARRPHRVLVAQQTRDGIRDAATICTDLARSFPRLRALVMCGIAGGVPAPTDVGRHVRLGDVVVATEGIVDYDHVRTVDGASTVRRVAFPPSAALLRGDNTLRKAEYGESHPWLRIVAEAARVSPFVRPDPATDVLYVGGRRRKHPEDPRRADHRPLVHRGVIGSASRLLRDAVLRDELARRHRIVAVEMEGSGVAAAADLHDRSWFMVRGAADYCDDNSKNDVWHPYAALTAAAYLRALLAECRPLTTDSHSTTDSATDGAEVVHGLTVILDTLSVLPQLSEEPARRVLIRQLPVFLRTAVPDNPSPRLHVLNIIQTCASFEDGMDHLLAALRVVIGPSPEMQRIEAVVRAHWTGR